MSVDKSAGTLQGIPVEHVAVDTGNGTGVDVFMAPTLQCRMLRLQRRAALVLETSISERLQVSDPDPALFSIPPAYKLENVTRFTSAASSSVKVDPIVQTGKLLQVMPPVYPPMAKQARIQGVVKLQIVIGVEGYVQDAKLLTGLPILALRPLQPQKNINTVQHF